MPLQNPIFPASVFPNAVDEITNFTHPEIPDAIRAVENYLIGASPSDPMILTRPLLFNPDNTYDIGAPGARPRDVYAGRNFISGNAFIVGGTYYADGAVLPTGSNIMEQRNATNPQTWRLYNTYTDPVNYERLALTWSSNAAYIVTERAGTGVARPLVLIGVSQLILRAGAANGWSVLSSGHFLAEVDNSVDIGAAGANRPRTIYAATSFVGPGALP